MNSYNLLSLAKKSNSFKKLVIKQILKTLFIYHMSKLIVPISEQNLYNTIYNNALFKAKTHFTSIKN